MTAVIEKTRAATVMIAPAIVASSVRVAGTVEAIVNGNDVLACYEAAGIDCAGPRA